MKTKAAVLNSNNYIVLAFLAAVLAFVFSAQANAALSKSASSKKNNAVKIKAAKKVKAKALVSKSPVLKKKSIVLEKAASSVMFLNSKQRQLLAQNSADAAADAKLEGEMLSDSIPVAAPAQGSLASQVAAPLKAEKDVVFGATIVVEASSGINTAEKKEYSGGYTLVPSVTHNPSGLSANAKLVYAQNYTVPMDDGKDGDLSSPVIRIRKTVKVGGLVDDFYFGPNFTIPAGREAKRQTLNGGAGAVVGIKKAFRQFSLGQEFSYSYRFYRYDIRDNGVVNSPHSFVSATSAGVEITKWFNLSAEFAVQQLINFRGTPTAFTTTAAEAGFSFSEKASLAIGLSTELAGTISDDGRSNRPVIYDPGVTAAYLSLTLSI